MTSDQLWLTSSDEGCHALQFQTLIGPFLSLSGLLLEWAGPTDKLHPRHTPNEALSALTETITQKLNICRVRERGEGRERKTCVSDNE